LSEQEIAMDRARWSIPKTRAWGVGVAAVTAVISGVAVFVNGYGVGAWRDAGVSSAGYTTAKNLVAALLLMAILWFATRRRSSEGFTRPTRRTQWLGLAAVGVIGGSVPFLLFFEGLARASSTQAAFIHKTLVLWVALLAIPLLRERLGTVHFGAIGLLLLGQAALAGGISDYSAGSGELMIAGATLLWSVEVIIAKRLLAELSAVTVGGARMGLGVVILVAYGIATGAFAEIAALGASEWGWALLTGLILTGYVGSWYLALARAQAVDVTGVLVFGAVVTAALRRGVQGVAAEPVGLALITMGTAVLIGFALLRTRRGAPVSG
jgi:drug/metabolite transporter (DMT)-like permease